MSENIEHYKNMINEKTLEQLNEEKISLGKSISDTAQRVQQFSGKDPERMDEQLTLMKELRKKLSIVIKRLQEIKD